MTTTPVIEIEIKCDCRLCSLEDYSTILQHGELMSLAKDTGIDKGWLSRIFHRTQRGNKGTTPKIEEAEKIATAMGVDIGCLYRALSKVTPTRPGQ